MFLKRVLIIVLLSIAPSLYAEESRFFDSKGVNIHYTDSEGSGDPVILLHGFTMDLGMWSQSGVIDVLAKNHRVIAIDLRGHGKSDKPATPNDYGPKVGDDVVRLLNHLKIEKTHIIGYSMGAFITGRILVNYPDRIHSAILVSGSFPVASEEEEHFNEKIATDMEEHGDTHLASVARGWSLDFVNIEEISKVTIPIQGVYGEEEHFAHQKEVLEMAKSSRPTIIIEGADHDSEKAAVLHPQFLLIAESFIGSIALK